VKLPRWTAYVSLAVIGTLIITAIPNKSEDAPYKGAARASQGDDAAAIDLPVPLHKRVVVLGIDGMDPDILREIIATEPELVPNFKKLVDEGDGIFDLGTSTPPQSPVAWSNFITGRNPGGHGVFDFIHRNPETYALAPSTVTVEESTKLPGDWEIPAGGDTNRSGTAFWTILGEHDIPADVWRMPINFPVEEGKGLSFPGMMTPAVDSPYGKFTFFTTDVITDTSGQKIQVQERSGVIRGAYLSGPGHPFNPHSSPSTAPLEIYIDEEAGAAVIDTGLSAIVLKPGQWSDFANVSFSPLPLGLMDAAGIVRFYLRSITPEFELYASPINVDPYAPIAPISYPEDASADLADAIGNYYTQGMAEDVNALKKKVLTDDEFMQQVNLVYQGRNRMLDQALDVYLEGDEGGLMFFYFSTVDLAGHMMWRLQDEQHPSFDADIAAQDSTWFTERAGTTWKTIIRDLYVKMDPVLGQLRKRIGEDTLLFVMSDHGFAPYHRKFSLNTWLLEEGYLVLKEDMGRELPQSDVDHQKVYLSDVVDWTKSRAYGMGFNGLYLNLEGREAEGIVAPGAEADTLIKELQAKLQDLKDDGRDGTRIVLNADLASEIYTGERVSEAPDILVGYNSGYGNSDPASEGRIPNYVIEDNMGGTFNGSHLMDPRVVSGILLTNGQVGLEDARLEDLTVELLRQYGVAPAPGMVGRPVLR
jgi:predicted AlkP superfamily phosphohydrolase/phosphomutase